MKLPNGVMRVLRYPSPPSRRRGLKFTKEDELLAAHVASFAEAWIEISVHVSYSFLILSPPSRRRGLKFSWVPFCIKDICRLLRGGVD